jgi:hypothetical protein
MPQTECAALPLPCMRRAHVLANDERTHRQHSAACEDRGHFGEVQPMLGAPAARYGYALMRLNTAMPCQTVASRAGFGNSPRFNARAIGDETLARFCIPVQDMHAHCNTAGIAPAVSVTYEIARGYLARQSQECRYRHGTHAHCPSRGTMLLLRRRSQGNSDRTYVNPHVSRAHSDSCMGRANLTPGQVTTATPRVPPLGFRDGTDAITIAA